MRSSCYESAVGTPGGVSAQQDNGVHIGTHPVQGPCDAEALPSRIQALRFLGPVGIPLGQIMGDQRPFQGRAEGHGDKLALVHVHTSSIRSGTELTPLCAGSQADRRR